MPRRSVRNGLGDTDVSSDDFQSPEENDQTSYGLDYTSHRILNPFQPSTSRAAQQSARKKQPTARKKTTHVPALRVTRSSPGSASAGRKRTSAAAVARTPARATQQPTGAHRRKNFIPFHNRTLYNLMQSTDFLIPRLPFGRLIREIITDVSRGTDVSRITRVALEALQESTEMYITQQLQDAYTLTLHRGRVTLQVKDMEVLRFLRGHI